MSWKILAFALLMFSLLVYLGLGFLNFADTMFSQWHLDWLADAVDPHKITKLED